MSIDEIVKCIVEGRARNKHYSHLRTVDDAKRYCEKNFSGMTRKQIQSDTRNHGGGFYHFIVKMGWRDIVLPEAGQKDYSALRTPADAKRYFDENFNGMTRSQLAHDKENGGGRFYSFLGRRRWRDVVLPPGKNADYNDYSDLTTVDDARRYYETNFSGMSRGRISLDVEGHRFYAFLIRRDWYDEVLPESKNAAHNDYSFLKTVDDAKQHYVENFQGMSRSQVQQDRTSGGAGFYKYLVRTGWRDLVLPIKKRRDYSILKTVDEAKRYYHAMFRGMSRGNVEHDHKNGGCGFYHFLRDKGWSELVLPVRSDLE